MSDFVRSLSASAFVIGSALGCVNTKCLMQFGVADVGPFPLRSVEMSERGGQQNKASSSEIKAGVGAEEFNVLLDGHHSSDAEKQLQGTSVVAKKVPCIIYKAYVAPHFFGKGLTPNNVPRGSDI